MPADTVPSHLDIDTSLVSPPISLSGLPQHTRDLHPVRDPFLHTWQRATAKSMAGPGASVWYRDMATKLDVNWRLAALAPTPLHIDNATRDLALDMAIAGASSGWDTAMRRTLRQSTELTPFHTFAKSILTPSLQVERGQDGSTRVKPDSAASLDSRAAMVDIDRGSQTPNAKVKPPLPSLRTGSNITLISIPTSDDVRAGTDAQSPISPGMTSWLDVRNIIFDAARVQARIAQPTERRKFNPNVRWAALARQEIIPSWAVVADLQGQLFHDTQQQITVRQGVALEHRLTDLSLSSWALRAAMTREVRDDLEPGIVEERFSVSLRADLGWYVPQDVDRWPLGHVPGGEIAPILPPTGPGKPMPFMASPAERTGAEPPPQPQLVAAR